jgi:hypothetical protein
MNSWLSFSLFTFVVLIGCADQPEQAQPENNNSSSNAASPDNDQIVKELQKQNELLAAQAERQKAEDAAKAKIEERKKHIDDISGQIAELVNDQGRKNAAILNISYSSQYNDLFNELKTLLNTATSNIEDEEEFRATVEKTSRDWATRKVLQ